MNSLDQARSLLPWWVVWGWLVVWLPGLFLLSGLAAWAGTALALGPLRKYRGDNWVERARLAWPARMVASRNVFALTILSGLCMLPALQLSPVPTLQGVALGGLAGLLPAMMVSQRLRRRLGLARGNLAKRLRGRLSFLLIAFPQLLVLVLLLLAMPPTWEWRALLIMLEGALLLLWLVFGGGLWLSRGLGAVWPASRRLTRLVAQTVERVGTRPRAVWEADLVFNNAIALPHIQSLLITSSMLDQMSDNEMIAILAHELAHLGEPRAVSVLRVATTFFMLPLGASVLIVDLVGAVGLMVPMLLLLLGAFLAVRLSRRMECEADRAGVAHEIAPGDYARALERLHEIELLPAVMVGQGQSHPHLYDRLLAAGVEPIYARPAPPSRWREGLGFLTTLVIFMGGAVTIFLGLYVVPLRAFGRSEFVAPTIALTGGDAMSFRDLASSRFHRNDVQQVCIQRLSP